MRIVWLPAVCLPPARCLLLPAAVAFGWISFFLWVGSTVISFQDWRGGVSGPPPVSATIPQSASVSMV